MSKVAQSSCVSDAVVEVAKYMQEDIEAVASEATPILADSNDNNTEKALDHIISRLQVMKSFKRRLTELGNEYCRFISVGEELPKREPVAGSRKANVRITDNLNATFDRKEQVGTGDAGIKVANAHPTLPPEQYTTWQQISIPALEVLMETEEGYPTQDFNVKVEEYLRLVGVLSPDEKPYDYEVVPSGNPRWKLKLQSLREFALKNHLIIDKPGWWCLTAKGREHVLSNSSTVGYVGMNNERSDEQQQTSEITSEEYAQ